MPYKISYKSSVQKDLKKISKSEASNILNRIEKVLSIKAANYSQLKGEFKRLRKFRIGNYRVIYVLEQEEVTILKIGHRKDVYK